MNDVHTCFYLFLLVLNRNETAHFSVYHISPQRCDIKKWRFIDGQCSDATSEPRGPALKHPLGCVCLLAQRGGEERFCQCPAGKFLARHKHPIGEL